MPFKSKSQNRWAHTIEGQKEMGSKLDEWEKATKNYDDLPEHVTKKRVKDSIIKKLTKNKNGKK